MSLLQLVEFIILEKIDDDDNKDIIINCCITLNQITRMDDA